MTDQTERAGKRGSACSRVKGDGTGSSLDRNGYHCPCPWSSDDGQERIPLPVVTCRRAGTESTAFISSRTWRVFRKYKDNGKSELCTIDCMVCGCMHACSLVWTRGCTRETRSSHSLGHVPLFIQPLPLSRRGLDSAVRPSYSCRNLYFSWLYKYVEGMFD